MFNDSGNIEDLFGKVFRNAEETPPGNMWDNLESSLNDSKVDQMYESTFKNAVEKPSDKVWKKISQALWLRAFFQFNPQTINVYYAAITAVVGVVAYNVASSDDVAPKLNQEFVQQVSIEKNESVEVSTSSIMKEDVQTKEVFVKAEIPKETPKVIKPTFEVQASKNTTVSSAELEFNASLENIKFSVSNSVVCENVPIEFRLEGMPKDYSVTWDFDTKTVKSKVFNAVAEAAWSKAGSYTIKALVSYKSSNAELKHTITVEKAEKPIIKGSQKVCEGEMSTIYQIDAPVDKAIVYNWDNNSFEGNVVNQVSEKQVKVDWTFPGNDTLVVTKINTVTGCKTEAFFPVFVQEAPVAKFTYGSLGEGDFEFTYLGHTKRGTSVEWLIEGESLEGESVVVSSNGIGHSMVTLIVKDKNNCVSKTQKEISFYDYIIKVPETFTPTEGFDARRFLPLTNTPLKTYKIEIFDASNELVWESTSIQNGVPSEGWDGKIKGELAPEGKYLWRISAVFKDGIEYKGVPQPNGECKPSKLFVIEY